MLYYRLYPILDQYQPDDQFGFRRDKRIEDIFAILENIMGKTDEWNLPVWMISLDLRKAFDTIQFTPLFTALRNQGVPEAYVQLLAALYEKQKGSVNGSTLFDILRGVKQGDVLSSMLFNAGLEAAFSEWRCRLTSEGFLLSTGGSRLTNVRYADDVMLFAKSVSELENMVELLVVSFGNVGLELNASKSKILTNDNIYFDFMDIAEHMVEIIQASSSHKYLGRYLSGEFAFRETTEVHHRIKCAWFKFSHHSSTLCNKNICIKLRLKYFDAVITPTILFGLVALPLNQSSLDKLEVTQKKMMRKMVGWVRLEGETWETTMRRMKHRVNRALVHVQLCGGLSGLANISGISQYE